MKRRMRTLLGLAAISLSGLGRSMKRRMRTLVALAAIGLVVMLAIAIGVLDSARPESEWIRTDKEQYQQGERVVIYFRNLTDETVEIGDYGIHQIRLGVFGVEVEAEEVYNLIRIGWIVVVRPGETFTWTWDQTYHNVRDGPPSGAQVPPGRYAVWWVPFETEHHEVIGLLPTGATVGYFRQWFEIIEGDE